MPYLLTAIVFVPLVGAAITALLRKESSDVPRVVAVVTMIVDVLLVAWAFAHFEPGRGIQFAIDVPWVAQAQIRYHMGIDGVALTMLGLSALLGLLAVLGSWKVTERPKTYFALLLLLQVGMNGVFVALDLVLFYVFWELVLVPMYFLIGMWGGPRREYAAMKFFIYTLLGSVLMLVGIIALRLHPAGGTFDMIKLIGAQFPANFQMWVFAAFFLGFAVKVPVWPLHTWLPDAHVEAPTAASVLLAGILLKMGTYGFIRISLPILPIATKAWQPYVAVLAVISIIYGAAVAFAQADMKKLVAYSSVSHMGFAMLGIFSLTAAGIAGGVAVMVSHGLITGMLFFLVGMSYERTHTRQIAEVSGLVGAAPVLGGLLAFASFASLGLPGLSGFVGEFLSLLGAWQSVLAPWMTVAAAFGVLLAAAYMLRLVQRSVLGTPSTAVAGIPEIGRLEVVTVAPLVALIVAIGLDWNLLLQYVNPVATLLAAIVGKA
jgi:NADH-quinone oxidoreductase subunit M